MPRRRRVGRAVLSPPVMVVIPPTFHTSDPHRNGAVRDYRVR